MRHLAQMAAGALALSGALFASSAIAEPGGVKIGTLTCHVGEGWGYVLGSSKDLVCDYNPNNGGTDRYVGSLSKFGVDIGYTRGATLVWAVVAPTSDVGPGALQGDYAGATAGVTLIDGAGANVLFGGFDKSIALQPVSIEGNSGYFDVAAGIGEMSLNAAPPAMPPVPPQVAAIAPPAPLQPQHFAVFFDFNRASLTPEARSIVKEAAEAAEQSGAVRVRIVGHTDTVGSDRYNVRLSILRAESVKAEMVHDGLAEGQISVEGRGFHDPLVSTGPGVREPQNRRAIIDLGKVTVSENQRSLTRPDRSI